MATKTTTIAPDSTTAALQHAAPTAKVTKLTLPEAGGVCFTQLMLADYSTINITARGLTCRDALDELMETIEYAKQKYALATTTVSKAPKQPQASAAPLPAEPMAPALPPEPRLANTMSNEAFVSPPPPPPPAPAAQQVAQNEQQFAVTALVHAVTEKGKHLVKVMSPRFPKWGITAWEEVIPAAFNGWMDWAIGQPQDAGKLIPAGGRLVAYTVDGKKVSRFGLIKQA